MDDVTLIKAMVSKKGRFSYFSDFLQEIDWWEKHGPAMKEFAAKHSEPMKLTKGSKCLWDYEKELGLPE
jgi:hypothetical protein